jgi:hypothetical protein
MLCYEGVVPVNPVWSSEQGENVVIWKSLSEICSKREVRTSPVDMKSHFRVGREKDCKINANFYNFVSTKWNTFRQKQVFASATHMKCIDPELVCSRLFWMTSRLQPLCVCHLQSDYSMNASDVLLRTKIGRVHCKESLLFICCEFSVVITATYPSIAVISSLNCVAIVHSRTKTVVINQKSIGKTYSLGFRL